jgi:hypothetical protein
MPKIAEDNRLLLSAINPQSRLEMSRHDAGSTGGAVKCQVGRLEAEGLYGAKRNGYRLEPEETQTVEGENLAGLPVDDIVDIGVRQGSACAALYQQGVN